VSERGFFQRGVFARLRARRPELLSELAIAGGGVVIIGLTLTRYPAFDASQPPRSRSTLSPSAANRQLESAKSYLTSHAEDINAHVALTMAYFHKGPDYYVEGLNALEKARALGATSDHLFFYAGVMYDALGLPDYAINELTKYLRHHPEDYETTVRLANLHFKTKRYGQAETLYQQALRAWPKDGTAWYNYALLHKEKGEYDRALEYLDKAAAISGSLPAGGVYEKGEIARLKGDNDLAMTLYDQELAVNPEYIPALEAKEHMLRAKDFKASRALRKQISEIKKKQAEAAAAQPPPVSIPVPPPEPAAAAVPEAPAPLPSLPTPVPAVNGLPPAVPAPAVSTPAAPVEADTTTIPAPQGQQGQQP
jgi:tetratricopeptide (TPR) repeat protein